MNHLKFLYCILLSLLFSSCSSSLENLSIHKAQVQFYYESGAYKKELTEVLSDAANEFSDIRPEAKSAVIFDVDETALSNYEAIKAMGFGYMSEFWHKWVLEGRAPAIEEVKDFYKTLISRGFRIIFLTGRSQKEYDATYKNLIGAGYTKFDTLIVRSPSVKDAPAYNFKSIERLVLTQLGYKIVGCVGDQDSDIEGDHTGIKVRLPNYMYSVE